MIGPFLNALGILAGALFGLALRRPLSARTQAFFKSALGAAAVFYGLRLVGGNFHWPFFTGVKQILVSLIAIMLGYWVGRLCRLQTLSNRLGRHAAALLATATARKDAPGPSAPGFIAATTLFCAAPLGLLGAVADGLENYWYLLLVKGVMDGLAMMSFVKMFRWPVALSAVPVFFFFNSLALLVQFGAKPFLNAQHLTEDVCMAAGLITCSVALVILEVRRVELANFLPALVLAPLFAHWLT